ncbi:uncharacterized protein LOC129597563 [Paramacrobiotus metropolitanus]|uniref:uncharacterized protein LOC129597563 n=1 Tax=Paramacrobiotus metropolitanus TaxID=2943436 RepID=UPI0024461878|nr:uncharacterized protein LOC129597563 [Paramacrobiotus metropolitanus]XP_055351146.1 uncharacterized protein LOC129597563 [Paramacrobiotus metropolitanus]XP_055351147.1 uncharacterized protein LOC129597563 [Paramacrobiotus metropolitanus]
MGEVDEMFKRIMTIKGVQAAVAMTADGIVIRSTMEQSNAVHYAAMYAPLVQESRMAVSELGGNNVKTIRLRTGKHEVIIIPGKLYHFLVIQQPDASFDGP